MHQQLVAVVRHLVKILCCLWVTNLLAQEIVPPLPNDYAQVTSFNYCTNEVIIQTSSIGAFNTPGNEVILIQMQGAPRSISDDQHHGRHLSDLATAGYYEIHSISQALSTSNPGELRLRFEHNIEAVFDVSQSVQVVTNLFKIVPQNNKVICLIIPAYRDWPFGVDIVKDNIRCPL